MNNTAKSIVAALLVSGYVAGANATTVAIGTDGSWNQFDVDSTIAQSGGVEWIDNVTGPAIAQYKGDGSQISFTFTLTSQGLLQVVDAGFAGDQFQVFNGSTSLGLTSAVPATAYENNPPNAGTNFDAAFADHTNFSYLSLLLNPGTYTITGLLTQSVSLGGAPLDATVGALSVTAVPLPAAAWLLASSLLGGAGLVRRRRLLPA